MGLIKEFLYLYLDSAFKIQDKVTRHRKSNLAIGYLLLGTYNKQVLSNYHCCIE